MRLCRSDLVREDFFEKTRRSCRICHTDELNRETENGFFMDSINRVFYARVRKEFFDLRVAPVVSVV